MMILVLALFPIRAGRCVYRGLKAPVPTMSPTLAGEVFMTGEN